MPSFRWTVAAAAVGFVATARTDYTIEPNSVPKSTREMWCENEKDTCPLICQQTEPGTTLVNECDADSLTYGCLCGDNKRPNVSEYTLTLPYFVCQEWGNQCVDACSDNECASDCRQDNPCGATDPERANSTASATTAAATASQTDDGTTIYTGSPGDGDGSGGDKDGAGAALEIGRAYGLAIVLGGLFAGFSML